MNDGARRYRGFISYNRKDRRIARRLHRALERYQVPADIVAQVDDDRRLGRFFLDEDELPASSRLGHALRGAIEDSQALVVIASPAACESPWVEQEIEHFQSRGNGQVFAVVAAGTPNSGVPGTECFPQALRRNFGRIDADTADQPLAPDIAKEGFSKAKIRLIAGLLGIQFDALWLRESRRRTRDLIFRLALLLLAFLLGLIALAEVARRNDVSALITHSLEISRDGWYYYRDESFFDPSFRAALAASRLERHASAPLADLNQPVRTPQGALALSGRALPYRRLFGAPPTMPLENIRTDIEGGPLPQRRARIAPITVRHLAFSGDSRRIGLLATGGQLTIIDVASSRNFFTQVIAGLDENSAIALDETGSRCVVSGRDGMHLVDVESKAVVWAAWPGLVKVHEIKRMPGKWLVVADTEAGTAVYEVSADITAHNRVTKIPSPTTYYSDAFSADGAGYLVFAADNAASLQRVSLGNRAVVPVAIPNLGLGVGQVKAIATDAMAERVALGGNGSGGGPLAGAQVISLAHGKEIARLVGHTGEIYTLCFLPGADLVATGGSDWTLRLWSVNRSVEVLRLAGHAAPVCVTRFSSDGTWLATSSWDGTVLLWNVAAIRGDGAGLALNAARSNTEADGALTTVTADERDRFEAYQGRPWDIREWKAPRTLGGFGQSMRQLLVRWLGFSWFDYAAKAPGSTGDGQPGKAPSG